MILFIEIAFSLEGARGPGIEALRMKAYLERGQ
jgi:hypothetical protein